MDKEFYEKTQYILEDFYGNSFDIKNGDEIGKIMRGKYLIKELINTGSKSKIYLVVLEEKEYVAKVMTEKKYYIYIENEAKLLEKIENKHVVNFEAYYEEDAVEPPILLMEKLNGLSPLLYVQEKPEEKLKLTVELAKIYRELEEMEVIHGDIKLENIIIENNGNLKLIDFGLANMYDVPRGTVKYMAPETLLSGQKNIQSEVYSLCLNLYEFLYAYPYSIQDIKVSIVDEKVDLTDDIWLSLLITRGLHKIPSMRYSSFEELHIELNRYYIVNNLANEEGLYKKEDFFNIIRKKLEDEVVYDFYYDYYLYLKGQELKLDSLERLDYIVDYYINYESYRLQGRSFEQLYRQLKGIYCNLEKEELKNYIIDRIKDNLDEIEDMNEIEQARNLEKQGQFEEALKQYKTMILKGYRRAEYNLAMMYKQGRGLNRDYKLALDKFNNLSNIEYPNAIYQLGIMCQRGEGLSRDLYRAREHFEKAGKLGHLGSQNNLGIAYRYGYGVDKDNEKSFYWYKRAAEGGHIAAQNNLGFMYKNGYGTEVDYQQAFYWYKLSSENNNGSAQVNLAFLYREGLGVEKNVEKAFYWYKKASESGNISAKINLGRFYQEGWGVKRDYFQAVELYKEGVENENEQAMVYLAYMYQYGLGIEKNEAMSKNLFEKAIRKGSSLGQYYYGKFLIEASIKDYEQGIKYLKKSAKQKNTDAQIYLAKLYLEGKVVDKSFNTARKWYEIAIEEGSGQGYYELGKIYFDGKEVLQNYTKAFDYLYKGAKLGNREAQALLAHLYENGYGVKKDMGEALMWKNLSGMIQEEELEEAKVEEETIVEENYIDAEADDDKVVEVKKGKKAIIKKLFGK